MTKWMLFLSLYLSSTDGQTVYKVSKWDYGVTKAWVETDERGRKILKWDSIEGGYSWDLMTVHVGRMFRTEREAKDFKNKLIDKQIENLKKRKCP